MRITDVLLVTLGIALGFATSVGIVLTIGEAALLPAIQTIGSIAVAFSATVAFGVYLSNIRRHRQEDARKASETYLKESLSLLDKAHETFIRDGAEPPVNDRLLWLSTARMILRFQKLREQISEPEHIAVADENEEHTRLKFYGILGRNRDNFSREYFCPSGDLYSGENIDRKSIAVVFGFSRWKEGIQDPLSEIDDIELFARGVVPIDQFGTLAYLESYNKFWQKVQERKAQLNGSTAP